MYRIVTTWNISSSELVYSIFSLQEGEPKLDKKKSSPLMVTDIVLVWIYSLENLLIACIRKYASRDLKQFVTVYGAVFQVGTVNGTSTIISWSDILFKKGPLVEIYALADQFTNSIPKRT